MKTITATKKGIIINYHDTQKSSFIHYNSDISNITDNNEQQFFEMNSLQHSMYRRLMYGLSAYTSDLITNMNQRIKIQITQDHNRALDSLNKYKYEKYYSDVNKLLSVIFPKVTLDYYKDGKFSEIPTLKELKITTKDVINVWINDKLLPVNFYNLKSEEECLAI